MTTRNVRKFVLSMSGYILHKIDILIFVVNGTFSTVFDGQGNKIACILLPSQANVTFISDAVYNYSISVTTC